MKTKDSRNESGRIATRLWVSGLVTSFLVAFPLPTSAATVTLCLTADFSSPGPGSECPCCPTGEWVTVTFTDVGTGQVSMEITNRLMHEERVMDLYLNLNPGLNAVDLDFADPVVTGSFTLPTIDLGNNSFKAANDGYFDIRLAFSTPVNQGFGQGDALSYLVTIDGGELTARDFYFWSFPSDEPDAEGPFLAAAHILSTAEDSEASAWIGAIPEPSVLLLFTLGTMALLRRRFD